VELIVVGCSGSVSGPQSPASSYLVQAPYEGRTFSLVLDLGPGAFGALYNYLDPSAVDAIALSHLHPDHCLDVCAYYVAARYSPTARWPGIPLYGPRGTGQRLARAYDVPTIDGAADDPGHGLLHHFDHREWGTVQSIGPFEVRAVQVEHPVEAFALRIEERAGSGSLVYSGDTGPCPALTGLAAGADTLLAESAFLDRGGNRPALHLSGRDAAETGAAAGVGTLILTHIPPWHVPAEVLAEAVPHFDGPIELARPGARWTIG
jgi:ribonuclease BN (tRNA processing enzyme)